MFRRDWLSYFAVVGIVLAGAANAESIGNRASSGSHTQQREAEPKADAQPSIPVAVQNNIERITRALEAANAKQPSDADKQNDAANLEAQRDMALSARRMFYVGLFEALITALGVFLVWRTLLASWTAANEAKRAADAAETALAAQDRPHVLVLEITFSAINSGPDEANNAIHYGYKFQNYGEDVAFLRKCSFCFFHSPATEDIGEPKPHTVSQKLFWPVPPSSWWGAPLNADNSDALAVTEPIRDEIISGTRRLYVSGDIEYRDPSGNSHAHRFLYAYRHFDRKVIPWDDERYWEYT